MNSKVAQMSSTSVMPNLRDLVRDIVAAYKNWRHERFLASIDFRELREDEVTDEMRAEAAEVLKLPREEFLNL